jgi:hypothetical protein
MRGSMRWGAPRRRCVLLGRDGAGILLAGANRPAASGLTGRGRGTCVRSRKKRHGRPAGPAQDRYDPGLLWRRIRSGRGSRLPAFWTERTGGRAATRRSQLPVLHAGFLPGFPYLTGLDPMLATPQATVPAGSVGIAGHRRASTRCPAREAGTSSAVRLSPCSTPRVSSPAGAGRRRRPLLSHQPRGI